MRSTSKLIHHQFSQLKDSQKPDFIWYGINKPRPDLYDLMKWLEKGRQIQRDFLPAKIPQIPNWEIAACFYPGGKVSGDFYDVFMLPDGYMGLVIADVCDKGEGSALYMALFRSLIRVFAEQAAHCTGPALAQIDQTSVGTAAQSASGNGQMVRLCAVAFTNNCIAPRHDDVTMFAVHRTTS